MLSWILFPTLDFQRLVIEFYCSFWSNKPTDIIFNGFSFQLAFEYYWKTYEIVFFNGLFAFLALKNHRKKLYEKEKLDKILSSVLN